jgi:hypothetical protein
VEPGGSHDGPVQTRGPNGRLGGQQRLDLLDMYGHVGVQHDPVHVGGTNCVEEAVRQEHVVRQKQVEVAHVLERRRPRRWVAPVQHHLAVASGRDSGKTGIPEQGDNAPPHRSGTARDHVDRFSHPVTLGRGVARVGTVASWRGRIWTPSRTCDGSANSWTASTRRRSRWPRSRAPRVRGDAAATTSTSQAKLRPHWGYTPCAVERMPVTSRAWAELLPVTSRWGGRASWLV